ncbi:transposable element Tcb1 transposase [Trichonephila clavipes]|nr:transposable element Tcb1 transposase [Trichonephila clavipes]
MQWSGIAYSARSSLVLIRGTMRDKRYVHDILLVVCCVATHAMALPGVIFQQDNDRPHTARVSQDCLPTVTTLPWPDLSPDLSPIQYIWDYLGRM